MLNVKYSKDMKGFDFIKDIVRIENMIYDLYENCNLYENIKERYLLDRNSMVLIYDSEVFRKPIAFNGGLETQANRQLPSNCQTNELQSLVIDDLKLVGFICINNINEDLYLKILSSNKLIDDDITSNDLLLDSGIGYLMSVCLLKEYRDSKASKMLYEGYNYLVQTNNLKKVLATAISKDGSKFLINVGMNFVNNIENDWEVWSN